MNRKISEITRGEGKIDGEMERKKDSEGDICISRVIKLKCNGSKKRKTLKKKSILVIYG